jgi:amino acid permease
MADNDNIDLVFEAIVSTHEQQLETLRHQKRSLLKLARFNIILLGIMVSIAGISSQRQYLLGFLEFFLPIGCILAAILMSIAKYYATGSYSGPTLEKELTAKINNISREEAFKDIVGVYEEAGESNKNKLESIDRWISMILVLMSISLGILLGSILLSA